MNLLLIFLWVIPFIAWVAIIHLWLVRDIFSAPDNATRRMLIVIEVYLDVCFAILYFLGISPKLSNFIILIFR